MTGITVSPPQYTSSLLASYVAYDGPVCGDPRTVNVGTVTDGLRRIIEIEGPMLAKRAYDIYLRGCGIKRMGHDLGCPSGKYAHKM